MLLLGCLLILAGICYTGLRVRQKIKPAVSQVAIITVENPGTSTVEILDASGRRVGEIKPDSTKELKIRRDSNQWVFYWRTVTPGAATYWQEISTSGNSHSPTGHVVLKGTSSNRLVRVP
jgi:hypothetical protein